MIERRPSATTRKSTRRVMLNGRLVSTAGVDPVHFAKGLTEKRRTKNPRLERLERAEAALKAWRK